MKTRKQLLIKTMIKSIYMVLLTFSLTLTLYSCGDEESEQLEEPDQCKEFAIDATRNNDNEITIKFTQGSAPFSYLIAYEGVEATQSGTASSASEEIEASEFAAATITVTDANNCKATANIIAGNHCTGSNLTISIIREIEESTDVLAFEITGGEEPYSYEVNYENDTSQTGESEERTFQIETTSLAAATVTVKDNADCIVNELVAASVCNGFDVGVERNTIGSIEFAINEGLEPFSFSIAYEDVDTPQTGSINSSSFDISATSPNAAEITISDANGCEAIVSIGEDLCDGFTAIATGENSAITVTITAGIAPYDYSVAYEDTSTPQIGSSDDREFDIAVNTAGKAATVTITDANGCEVITNEVSAQDINSFVDSRDGNRYSTANFNGLTWMTENYRGEYPYYRCYDNEPDNCSTYGGLYTWAMATSGNIAPEGWRLPTASEVLSMLDAIEGDKEQDAIALLEGGSTNLNFIHSGWLSSFSYRYFALIGKSGGMLPDGRYWLKDVYDETDSYSLSIVPNSANLLVSSKENSHAIRFVKE